MMFQILLHHFIRDVARTPCAVPDCPQMIAPISLFQLWKARLQKTRRAAFEPLNQLRDCHPGRIFEVHMNVIFRDHARQDSHILSIANLHEQITTAHFYIALQNMVTIFRAPHYMHRQACDRMMSVSVIFHLPLFYRDFSGNKLKSCAQKRIASTSVL